MHRWLLVVPTHAEKRSRSVWSLIPRPKKQLPSAQSIEPRPAARAIEQDPAFVALLDKWACGDIEVKQMREQYPDILALQAAEPRGRWKNQIDRSRSVPSDEPTEE